MPRPIRTFEGFVGQRNLVRFVNRLVTGFRQLKQPLPPLLLLAPTGHGKTAFAEAIAVALGTNFHNLFACDRVRPQDLHAVLRNVNFGDLLFIDEAHSLARDAQQALFTAVDKYKIPAKSEDGSVGLELESVGEFTLALATNCPGLIRKALRSRAIQLSFEPYSVNELKAIALNVASREKIVLSAQAARLIAATAQGTPRLIYQRLKVLQLYNPNVAEYTLTMVRACLEAEGVDRHGLRPVQRHYLQTLATMPKGQCVLEHIATRLGLDARFIREEAEYYLVDRRFVAVLSNNARRLTHEGREMLETLKSTKS